MSTHLGTIKGKVEKRTRGNLTVEYAEETLHVGSFWGGIKRGKSLGLSLSNTHIQLDNAAAKQLLKILQENYSE